jgi:outer membrane receptor protein involved in Fe transport
MLSPAPAFSRFRVLRPILFLLLGLRLAAASLTWDLPAQPAVDSLLAVSEKSGSPVLFPAKELAGVPGRAVHGEHEPLAALQIILAGTNFEAVATERNRLVVRARPRSRLSGFVRSGARGAGHAGATVAIEGGTQVAVTGKNGRFELNAVPAGTYTVVVSADGMQTVRVSGLAVEAGRSLELLPVTLVPEGQPVEAGSPEGLADSRLLLRLEDMVVMPSRFGVSEDLSLPVATVTHEELDSRPKLGEDLYRAISGLPGLATTDYSAKFWVRGAPYEQVLARLDGATLVEPFHMKDLDGVISIIDTEMVDRLSLTTGGFTVEYGDRLAGVLEMETASHLQPRMHTTLGLSLTGARATNRGAFASGQGNWLVSARVGYPDIAIEATDSNIELKPRYYDVFAKGEYELRPGHVISLHVLHAGDTLENTSDDGDDVHSSYDNDYVWARWRGEFSADLKAETVLSYAWLGWHGHGTGEIDGELPFRIEDDRELKLATLRSDWSLLLADGWLLRTGFELQDANAEYDYYRLRSLWVLRDGDVRIEPRVIEHAPDPHRVSAGVYGALRFQAGSRLTLEPGVRFDESHDDGAGSGFSPRLNAAYDLGRATLRAAWGLYRQEQGLHEIGVKDGDPIIHPAEEAEQRVFGVETRLGARMNLRAEVYQRITDNPRPHGQNPFNVGEALGELFSDRVLLRPTHAEAQGFELIVEGRAGKTFDWSASYALAKTEQTINGVVVPRERDQRHAIHVDASYRPNPNWQFTAAWQYHTGWPYTVMNYSDITLADGRIVFRGTAGSLYGERLPAYHRLDLRATRIFPLKHGTLRAFIDVFNAYGQENALSYTQSPFRLPDGTIVAIKEVDELFPILPSFGLIWDF